MCGLQNYGDGDFHHFEEKNYKFPLLRSAVMCLLKNRVASDSACWNQSDIGMALRTLRDCVSSNSSGTVVEEDTDTDDAIGEERGEDDIAQHASKGVTSECFRFEKPQQFIEVIKRASASDKQNETASV